MFTSYIHIALQRDDASAYAQEMKHARDAVTKFTLARKRCFATFAGVGGGVGATIPLGVSKRSVVELRGKGQQIALAEYSRLVVLFLVLGQYLIQLW